MTKVIIIGAGIGGLCAAIALQNIGFHVEVYEQSTEPRAAGAGLTLWANAVRALRQLGADETLTTASMEGINSIHRWDGVTLSAIDAKELQARYGSSAVAVHRVDFMRALLAKAGNVVEYGTRLTGYQQEREGVRVAFEDGKSAVGDLLIGADGMNSAVRGQMHPNVQPVYRGYSAWRGVIPFDHEQVKDMWGETWGTGARFGIVPLNQGRVYWFATANRPPNTPPDDHHVALRELFGNWHEPIPALLSTTPDDSLLYNDVEDIEPLATWVDGRVALLGDAAHGMTPNMGQGACQAIEDALVLAQVLQQVPFKDALSVYEKIRLAHTRQVVLQSRRIGRMGQLSHPLLVMLRNAVMRATPSSVLLRQLDFVLAHRS